MAKTLGYMITFTTYGTWLQGDERGYVKNGRILPGDETLKQTNEQLQVQDKVVLSKAQQQVVRQAIIKEAQSQNQRVLAMSVNATHVHIVAECNSQPINNIVAYYKKAARLALKDTGHEGKTWTKGYDKRFCFDQETLQHRIKYVQNQNPGEMETPGETGGKKMKKYLAPRLTWGFSAAALPQVHAQIEKRANLIDTDHPAP